MTGIISQNCRAVFIFEPNLPFPTLDEGFNGQASVGDWCLSSQADDKGSQNSAFAAWKIVSCFLQSHSGQSDFITGTRQTHHWKWIHPHYRLCFVYDKDSLPFLPTTKFTLELKEKCRWVWHMKFFNWMCSMMPTSASFYNKNWAILQWKKCCSKIARSSMTHSWFQCNEPCRLFCSFIVRWKVRHDLSKGCGGSMATALTSFTSKSGFCDSSKSLSSSASLRRFSAPCASLDRLFDISAVYSPNTRRPASISLHLR